MFPLATLLSVVLAGIAVAGMVQTAWGLHVVRRFASEPAVPAVVRPAISVLKPLHGDEPLLEEALESLFTQDYPRFQIVFGVQSPTDPAIGVVRTLRQRYPERDVALVIDTARHGVNHKVSNLINMFGAARHDVLVIADSDVHTAPNALDRIAAALEVPGTGVVTTLYAGRAAHAGPVGALGASYISHVFLPGALLARALRRQDCLGATMALRRSTLEAVGGLPALVDHLADDAVLGQLVRRQGLTVRLAATVPTTTVPEVSLRELFEHELRWARTIRSLVPVGHGLSLVQFPIAWALLCAVASLGAVWSLGLVAAAWLVKAVAARDVDRALGLPHTASVWWMPLRDIMCVAVIAVSYRGRLVHWRGQVVPVGPPLYGLRDDLAVRPRVTEHAT